MDVLYGFTAKEIQKYILDGDKLREMIGGSEIINSICTDFIKGALEKLGITNNVVTISEVAGGVRLQMNNEDAHNLARVFPLLVDQIAPSLKCVQAIEPINDDVGKALVRLNERLEATRSILTESLPEIGPLIERNTRTGAAAVCRAYEGWHDRRTQSLEKTAESKGTYAVLKNFAGGNVIPDEWPVAMEHMVTNENNYLAVVHADGNDLGKMVIKLVKAIESDPDAQDVLAKFSKAVEQATFAAAQEACNKEIIKKAGKRKVKDQSTGKEKECYPARPIVLGGDDITVIMRADLALPFLKVYLELFEKYTKENLDLELGKYGLGAITACAGIAFVKSSYPFWRAYELVESLTEFAKEKAKADDTRVNGLAPSSLAFHRVTTSITGDFKEIRERELKGNNVSFCFGPYAVGNYGSKMHSYEQLKRLAETIAQMPSGPIRKLISTMHNNSSHVNNDFNRIIEIANRATPQKLSGDAFKNELEALTKNNDTPIWTAGGMASPLLDALRLIEVGSVIREKDEEVAA